ncbi:helix-turn-helix domain-containing protein [Paenibacillus sp. GSMTC-2017]|uniref:PucR family transcriptional regulator n=1 Tax=Paenibacillus sp. GSMTC-2017 TaxID=2794350 RepID=UPI0018D69CBF|nr:PucR family transcriptional regulator [Paenibacillus sp. GSMTC-2017]MBH5320848.1 helix-turn-helix domain-containing protein [Paenibacillus sp. GSMTC-2017]
MSTTDWLKPLEHILNCPIQVTTKDVSEWKSFIEEADSVSNQGDSSNILTAGVWALKLNCLWFITEVDRNTLTVLEVSNNAINEKEKELISWTLQLTNKHKLHKLATSMSDSERLAMKLSEWIEKQLESDEPIYSLPDHLVAGSRFYQEMIPFLLITEQAGTKQASYLELEKLLKSFLSDDILLIPLKSQEWLIWGPLTLLKDADADLYDQSEEESVEDSLSSIALGLHEMLASEWLGECHLAVIHPVSPARAIIETTLTLRETINLGRKFHVGTNIHLPWKMQLERLLNAIPEMHRSKYLEQSLKRTDLFVEVEMLATLETFFSLDCNVSETAKKLYIHRNTLLYRLDKLKQETGLDVRLFRDAVLVKIILLLYKVTKRN